MDPMVKPWDDAGKVDAGECSLLQILPSLVPLPVVGRGGGMKP